MRKSTVYLTITAIGAAISAAVLGLHPVMGQDDTITRLHLERTMVNRLQLTDIALFTESPYTRHPNLADRFVPFQNHPMAISPFPSESLLIPPMHLLDERAFLGRESRP